MRANKATEIEIVVSIPDELKPYRPALSASLFYLALGENTPESLPKARCKSTRVQVSETAYPYLQNLTTRFGSQRKAIIHALTWASQQNQSRLAMLGNTSL